MKNFRNVAILTFVAIGCMLFIRSVSAATLSVTAKTAIPLDSTEFVSVLLNSEGQTVNAVDVTIRYDPNALIPERIVPISKFITLWTDIPRTVTPGTIQFSGGRPDGSMVVDAPLITILFRPLKVGSTTVTIADSATGVYLNDGLGTPADLTVRSLALNVVNPLNLISQPKVVSHPNEYTWSPQQTVIVQWKAIDNEEVTYTLNQDVLAEPEPYPSENIGSIEYPNLVDGVWYFTFRERTRGQDWGPTYRRAILIDATHPDPFTISETKLLEHGGTLLSFQASDAASGIASYRAVISERDWWNPLKTRRTVVATNEQLLLDHPDEVVNVEVTAFDRAGNERTATWYGVHHNRQQLLFAGTLVVIAAFLAFVLLLLVRIAHAVRRTFSQNR